MHEASLHEENAFISLTYADEHLPRLESLDRKAFPLFMRRLRKAYSGRRIRYYHCGEYGDRFGRPHYHSCLFGFDFRDKTVWTSRNGFPVWRSEELERLWPYGQSEIGSVTFESAAYVARYVVKKVRGSDEVVAKAYQYCDPRSGEIGIREREYATMSRRPGIGREWYEKYKSEVYPEDEVVVRGRLMKPPRYYDGLYELEGEWGPIRGARKRARREEDETPERLEVRREVAQAKVNLKSRRLE